MRWGSLCGRMLAAIVPGFACAGVKEVQLADPPGWVIPPPNPTQAPTPDGAPLRMIYSDNQIRLSEDGAEIFHTYRVRILRPEALALGNIALSWLPDAGDAKIHHVHILRDQQVVDVLKNAEFQVIQREGALEKSILNGELTAVLQSPGIQVGDELEVAATVRYKDRTLGDHLFGFATLPSTGLPGAFRIRLTWPKGRNLHWRVSPDVQGYSLLTANGQEELIYELKDPHSAVVADGAPARINVRRAIEYSDFDGWPDVSRRIWPLFEKAAVLRSDSPVRREAARIAAAEADPLKRMEAALRLVQDRIRYVYIGFNGGNFTPATADETWERRFGDCKAKTALLLSLLGELGIRGEAVLVDASGGDGLDERLPGPALFNHVLVRVTRGSSTYWLDGTRSGDKSLASIPPPYYRWVLPLRQVGSQLERIATNPARYPYSIEVIDIDATRGVGEKGRISVQRVLRGDQARNMEVTLRGFSGEDADHAQMAYWRKSSSWIEPETVSWRFDDERGVIVLKLVGLGKLDWSGDADDGRQLDIPGAGFTPPAEYHRPKEQDPSAPWALEYPAYRCWATAIHLPPDDANWKWDYFADPMDVTIGGVRYWRASDLRDGVVRTVMSRRAEVPEISATQAGEVNKQLSTFNNKISRVFQRQAKAEVAKHPIRPQPPFAEDTDWASDEAPCGITGGRR